MLELTDKNFQQQLKKSEKPVLVDFWATWCQPCKMLSPILEKVAQENQDKITVAKVNVDSAPQTSKKFEIQNIPTVVLFHNAKPINNFIGARPKPFIEDWLKKVLNQLPKQKQKNA